MRFVKYIFRGAAVVGGLACLLLTALTVFQNKLLYVPVLPEVSKDYDGDPSRYGIVFKNLYFEAKDGVKLHAWLLYPPDAPQRQLIPAVLFFQENAGNISHRLPFINILIRQLNCIVFMLSYRGYGASEGSPNQQGIELDSQAALDILLQQPKVDANNIFVYGKSLGGAVSLHLARNNQDKIKAAIIENAFSSVYDMVP